MIQDFEMPAVSNCIRLSSDGHYILATGIYKPRVRCYDVDNLAMKFERCFDSEVISFEILSDDYSKVLTFFLKILGGGNLSTFHFIILTL